MTGAISWQASCVAIGERAVLIEGAPGTGKSSLALALIDRGARLIGDDSVLIEAHGDTLLARPHPNTRGLIEVRNLGLLSFPVCDEAPVALVLAFDANAPRFVELAGQAERGGVVLPHLRLWPEGGTAAIKAELALEHYGLTFL